MKSELLALSKLTIIEGVERPVSKVDDDLLRRSIEAGGIQQPLIAVEDGAKLLLCDGLRRHRIAQAVGISRAWVMIDRAPKGIDPIEYVLRLRFLLDQHRQDLVPSQKAALIETLKSMFSMNHTQVAAYLGIDPDSVTNWLAVKRYIPPVVAALDAGLLTMQGARAFDGMTDKGQDHLWRHHASELTQRGGGKLHKELRKQYPPSDYPKFYRDAALVTSRLARTSGKRKSRPRPSLSKDDKSRLIHSYEVKETELEDAKEELAQLKSEIRAAAPVVSAILRNEKLLALVPDEMLPELERFAEIY